MALTLAEGHRMGWEAFGHGCDRERGPFLDRKSQRSRRMKAVRRAWLEGWDEAMNLFAQMAADLPWEVFKTDVLKCYVSRVETRPME